MGYFDRVKVSLHILQTANQETEGSQDRLTVKLFFKANGCVIIVFYTREYKGDREGIPHTQPIP